MKNKLYVGQFVYIDRKEIEDHVITKVGKKYFYIKDGRIDVAINKKELIHMNKNEQNHCPEFPFFGAPYPDATCIDGYLWDLDSGDDRGLTSGGDVPCPFCNTEEYVRFYLDDADERYSRFDSEKHIAFLKEKYGNK